MSREFDEAIRAAARSGPQLPQAPARAHRTDILDGGWTIGVGPSPMGGPAVIISAIDGSLDMIYPFRDVLHFAEFRAGAEQVAEAFRQRHEAGQDNGQPD